MIENHPITPPPELVQQWTSKAAIENMPEQIYIATQAARWGADQELEACCAAEHTVYGKGKANWLRSLRRPKPPSLAEKALKALLRMNQGQHIEQIFLNERAHTIRRALERLQELEKGDD